MGSNGSSVTWRSLLDDTQQAAHETMGPGYGLPGYSLPGAVCSGHSFRARLEAVDIKRGNHKVSRLDAKLLPTYKSITELSYAVGHSTAELQGVPPSEGLEALVWWTSFALIEGGWKAGADLDRLAALVADLNKKVPSFVNNKSETLQFPNNARVQKPLQKVYTLFIKSHFFILSHLLRKDRKDKAFNADPTQDEVLIAHINETAREFETARGTYDQMVHQAAEDQAREETDRQQPSLETQRYLPAIFHQQSGSNRETNVTFVSIKPLGSGSHADVDEVRELTTGASYARKLIKIDGSGRSEKVVEEEVKKEVRVMQKLRHLHIATIMFYLKEETAYSIFMIPVAQCNLQEYMINCSAKDYPVSLTKHFHPWCGCLLDALAYAHKVDIKHQDIKPSNVLIKDNQPFLADFGLAKDFAADDNSISDGNRLVGNSAYRAPEVQPSKQRGRKADIFSLGCMYSEMITVCHGRSTEDYRRERQEAGSTAFRSCLTTVERWLKQLERTKLSDMVIEEILCMIRSDPRERHGVNDALKFLKGEPAFFCVER
ncbi:MAG: hypothetical protein Q9178_005023 [Gyalolechia marmorata]